MISFSTQNRFKFIRICYLSLSFIHSVALLVLTSILFIRSWIVSETAVTVLLSAKLCKSEPMQQEKYVFHEYVENIGSSIDPCGMSDRINFKKLKLFLILTHGLCPLKYDSISFRVLVSKPYSSSFATNKSWDKQLNTFNRSIRGAPTILFSSRHLRHSSIILKITC